MIVVSNASPLIALALIEQLGLLPVLYGQIHLAVATRKEVIGKGKRRPGAAALAKAEWLVVETVSRRALASLRPRPAGLHVGEVETIALAIQLQADVVLMDERLARNFAQAKGLNVLGTLGVLKYAAQRGLLVDLRAALDDLRSHNFRFSDVLYHEILSK